MKTVENCMERRELTELKVGKICLMVRDEKPLRVKIVNEDPLEVFLLDIGDSVESSRSQLFEIPPEIIDAAPFQAVECRLLGVKPKFGLEEWGKRLIAAFKGLLEEQSNGRWKLRVVRVVKNCHEVVLIHPESGERLDKIAVAERYADVGDEVPEISEDAEIEEAPETRQVTPGDILTEFSKNLKEKSEEKPKPQAVKQVEINETPAGPPPPSYKFIYKSPTIEWRQNEVYLYLTVTATDCLDYSLEIDDTSFDIAIKYKDRIDRTVINFYGIVQPQLVSHEKPGQTIIVRIPKHPSMMTFWPRIGQANEKNRKVIYSTEEIPERKTVREVCVKYAAPESDTDGEEELDDEAINMVIG
jgi:hypothetical protein